MSDTFRIGQVPSTAAESAYRFHAAVCASDEHIWPRTREQIQEYAEDGSLFAVVKEATGEFAGLVYAVFDEEASQWEIGGLTVAPAFQDRGLGTLLVRFALAFTFALEQPWLNHEHVVAHVHEENFEPRNVLHRLGFDYHAMVEIPGDVAPLSMKRNANLNVSGMELRFTAAGFQDLTRWIHSASIQTLKSGEPLTLDLGKHSLSQLQEALADTQQEPPV